jgi:lysylphosphatidylglycerol synthetase-like protein (DUF2156 family)
MPHSDRQQKTTKPNKTVLALFIAAIIFEVLNIIVSGYLGSIEAKRCTSSQVPHIVSFILLGASLASAALASLLTQKLLVVLYALFWAALIITAEYIVLYMAGGGIKLSCLVW